MDVDLNYFVLNDSIIGLNLRMDVDLNYFFESGFRKFYFWENFIIKLEEWK